jgi:hypothetical protein
MKSLSNIVGDTILAGDDSFIFMFGLLNNTTGTATPIAGLAVMYGFNDPLKVMICALLCATASAIVGFIGSLVLRTTK